MDLLPLHKHSELKELCAEVLNEEWPRSKSARLHMLDKSNDNLPYSMVLVTSDAPVHSRTPWLVIGHSRLCKVHGIENACFVESVVVKKSLRGRGYGRILMEKTEEATKELGYTTIYLTTHDKQEFYGHLNYEFCDPVVSLGGASTLLTNDQLQRMFGSVHNKNRPAGDGMKSKAQKDAENVLTKTMTNSDSLSNLHELTIDDDVVILNPDSNSTEDEVHIRTGRPSVPVAPPLPAVCTSPEPRVPSYLSAIDETMEKGTPPHPPPPPPPAMPNVSSNTVSRLPQGQIFWMRKNLT